MFNGCSSARRVGGGERSTGPGLLDGMNKHLFSRPEVLILCLFLLWFASAAAYALVFTY